MRMSVYGYIVIAFVLILSGCGSGENNTSKNKHNNPVQQGSDNSETNSGNAESKNTLNSPEQLAEAYMQAVNNQDKSAIEKLIHWDGVENRTNTENWIRMMLRNQLSSIAVTTLTDDFKAASNKGYDHNGVRFVPNLNVEYVLTPRTEKGDGQISIGKKDKNWFIVAYIPAK